MSERETEDLEHFRELYGAPHLSWADKARLHANSLEQDEKAAEMYASEANRQTETLKEAREKVKYHETFLQYLANGLVEAKCRAMHQLRLHIHAKGEAERESSS